MLELDDIQHILLTRTPALTGQYEFVSFRDAAGGRAWLTALLDKVPTDRLVMALRGTDPAFQQIALSSLAARAKRMVEAELTSGQNPPQREIRAAQRSISDLALAMAGRGEIDLAPAEPEAVPAG